MKVKLVATDFEVRVDDVRVGGVIDCGDCWRAWCVDRRRGKALQDFDTKSQAVRAVVATYKPKVAK